MLREGAWCEVDVRQFHQNIEIIRQRTKSSLLLVIKAGAYGHGAVPMCQAAIDIGISMFGVATVDEADEISSAVPAAKLLVLSPITNAEIRECVHRGWRFFVWNRNHIETARQAANECGRVGLAHILIDTGMGRDGIQLRDWSNFFASCSKTSGVLYEGFATHFSAADAEDPSDTDRALHFFIQGRERAKEYGLNPPLVHAANSSATLRFPAAHFSMVRIGVIAYGLRPDSWMSLPAGISPILEWKARIVRVETLPPNHTVSYGGEYVTREEECVLTLPIGYADGFSRHPPGINSVLYYGEQLPVLGRVCMDQVVVRAPSGLTPALGDHVMLLGRSGDQEISAEMLAKRWGTNNYDVVVGIRKRVPRLYISAR